MTAALVDDGIGGERPLRLLIGAAGSISVLNLHQYILYFKKHLTSDIRVILTKQAARMIQSDVISGLIRNRVYEDFMQAPEVPAPHSALTRWADLFLVLPATPNTIGKAAGGLADDLLSSAILHSPRPVIFVPATPEHVWNKKAVQRNVLQLREDGHYILEPKKAVEEAYVVATGEYEGSALVPDIEDVCRVLRVLSLQLQTV
jgi:phosphopantothenoylcysteine synthetase/decarboxylase